jgi:hypothetical protein
MIERSAVINLKIAQTKDVCAAEATWVRFHEGMAGLFGRDEDETQIWQGDGSSKRASGDVGNPQKGQDLATLRALRKLVEQLEDAIGPDAHDAPKELPAEIRPEDRVASALTEIRAALVEMYGTVHYRKALNGIEKLVASAEPKTPTAEPQWRYVECLSATGEDLPGLTPFLDGGAVRLPEGTRKIRLVRAPEEKKP